MSEMVERVARAIWALNEDTDCHDYGLLAPHAKQRADDWARAAIKAMREPTEAMWKAKQPTWSLGRPMWDWWKDMIDEALK
jgi:hypothetical protein